MSQDSGYVFVPGRTSVSQSAAQALEAEVVVSDHAFERAFGAVAFFSDEGFGLDLLFNPVEGTRSVSDASSVDNISST